MTPTKARAMANKLEARERYVLAGALRSLADQVEALQKERNSMIAALLVPNRPTEKQWAQINAIALACQEAIDRARELGDG